MVTAGRTCALALVCVLCVVLMFVMCGLIKCLYYNLRKVIVKYKNVNNIIFFYKKKEKKEKE